MFKYQNVSKVEQTVTVTGNISPRIVKAGETVVTDVVIENPNFKYVGKVEAAGVQGVVTAEQPNVVTEAQKVEDNA